MTVLATVATAAVITGCMTVPMAAVLVLAAVLVAARRGVR